MFTSHKPGENKSKALGQNARKGKTINHMTNFQTHAHTWSYPKAFLPSFSFSRHWNQRGEENLSWRTDGASLPRRNETPGEKEREETNVRILCQMLGKERFIQIEQERKKKRDQRVVHADISFFQRKMAKACVQNNKVTGRSDTDWKSQKRPNDEASTNADTTPQEHTLGRVTISKGAKRNPPPPFFLLCWY